MNRTLGIHQCAALVALPALLAIALPRPAIAQASEVATAVDRVFARIDASGPGCTVGVAREGRVVLQRAFGMADLERGVPLDTLSILEAGSVAKQFTAAAVTLLALDGKLRFSDELQQHFPEIPRYERPITVRHLLDHTSGLRDWGDIAGMAGWPRGTRAYTHAHVLEIIARQRSLNYPPGSRYSYTNSGYNLLAMLVERVSGKSLDTFTRERLFVPLGMSRTSWRDDHRRIVPGRALAYGPVPGMMGLQRLVMPNEDAHGNGGLLTTVGDLLRWNEALRTRTVGGALGGALVDSLTRQGVLTDGTRITYAAGLVVDAYRGTPSIGHSGSTAGYRAYLARYPAQRDLSVAVLCNDSRNPVPLVLTLVDSLGRGLAPVAPAPVPAPVGAPFRADTAGLASYAGEYASDEVEVSVKVALTGGRLTLQRAPDRPVVLLPAADGRFTAGSLRIWFTRGTDGEPVLHAGTSRAYDVEFRRSAAPGRR